ncbi:MAG: hypothetical protein V3U72_00985 [Candidatus Aenigmarchaeota archaeon]
MIHGQWRREVSVSSYSDLSKLSPSIRRVHFRKFLSKNLIERVFQICLELESISISRYAFRRCDPSCIEMLENIGLEVMVSKRGRGRPNLLELNGKVRI